MRSLFFCDGRLSVMITGSHYFILISLLIFSQIYVLDVQVWYTVASALLGGLEGARDKLGEVILWTLESF